MSTFISMFTCDREPLVSDVEQFEIFFPVENMRLYEVDALQSCF